MSVWSEAFIRPVQAASSGPYTICARAIIRKNIQMLFTREHPEGMVFKVFVQPRASKNTIVGAHGDALKIKVTAPPVAGEANRMCLKFLAKQLMASPLRLEILSGHNSRTKQVLLRSEHVRPSDNEMQRLKQRIKKLIPD